MAEVADRVGRERAAPDVGAHRSTGMPSGLGAVELTSAALIALHLAVRGWVAFRGYFSLDDFTFASRAQLQPLGAHYLFHGYNGHLMPAGFLQVWLTTRAAPYSYVLVAGLSLLLQLAVDVQLLRLLGRLIGPRWAVPGLLAVYLFSVMSVPAMVWWAAALNQLPLQLALASALLACVRAVEGGGPRRRWTVLGWLLVGLAFTEKAALIGPLAFLFVVAVLAEGSVRERVLAAWRLWPRQWVAIVVLLVGYAVSYKLLVSSPFSAWPSWRRALTLGEAALGQAVVPGLAGGPLHWDAVGFVDSSAAAPTWLGWVTVALLLVLFEVSVQRNGSTAVGPWALLALCVLVDVALVIVARATLAGDQIVRDYRYFTELALLAPVLVGAALFRRPGRAKRSPVRHSALARAAAVGLVLLICANGIWSTASFARRWDDNPARAYVQNARAYLAAHPRTTLADVPVPQQVVWPVLHPSNLPSRLFVGDDVGDPRFRLPVERLRAVADDGEVRDALINGIAAKPGPDGSCGWKVAAGQPADVALTARLFAWGWVARIGYIASAPGRLVVSTDGTTTSVPVSRGLHSVFLALDGPVTRLRLSTASSGMVLCTDDVRIGTPAAWPAPVRGAR